MSVEEIALEIERLYHNAADEGCECDKTEHCSGCAMFSKADSESGREEREGFMTSHKDIPRSVKDAFEIFARTGRWGTCADCPRDSENHPYPEFCQNNVRYDHWLTVDDLAEHYKSHSASRNPHLVRREGEESL